MATPKPRRDRATELYTMASDLTVSDADLARHAAALTKRMNPPTQAFVINFAGVFRKHARQQKRAAA